MTRPYSPETLAERWHCSPEAIRLAGLGMASGRGVHRVLGGQCGCGGMGGWAMRRNSYGEVTGLVGVSARVVAAILLVLALCPFVLASTIYDWADGCGSAR